ncbi:MAG TPA: rhamnulokinase [Candidatus Omnitrophica bacterium]|nr:rhamnulokinase [Candidatus Omnitrophota bacterium]
MKKRIIIGACDLGASGGKFFAGIFEEGRFQMEEIHRFEHGPVTVFVKEPYRVMGRMYWDDLYLYTNIIEALKKYRRDFSDHLDSLGIDTWGSDGQFFTKDGDTLDRIYCYRDHRLDAMVDEFTSLVDPWEVYQKTGIHFWPFNISNQIYWFRKYRPELFQKAAFFLSVPGIFYYYLCGAKITEYTWASVTQLLNAETKQWYEEIFRAIDVPSSIMAPVVQPSTYVGKLFPEITHQLNLNEVKMIAVPTHDTACAFASAPVEKEEEALIISSGTWSLIGKLILEPLITRESMEENFSNEGGVGNIRFLRNCMGTWPIQELRRIWKEKDGKETSWEEITDLAEKGETFSYFIDPDDNSFYNPTDMESAIQEYCKKTGQSIPVSRAEILNTVYLSLALKYALTKECLEKICNCHIKKVHIVGGGAKNELLNQYTANAVGVPVEAGPFEATAVGNLMVQAMGLGVLSSLKEAIPIIRNAFPIKTYRPVEQNKWQKVLEKFKKMIQNKRK